MTAFSCETISVFLFAFISPTLFFCANNTQFFTRSQIVHSLLISGVSGIAAGCVFSLFPSLPPYVISTAALGCFMLLCERMIVELLPHKRMRLFTVSGVFLTFSGLTPFAGLWPLLFFLILFALLSLYDLRRNWNIPIRNDIPLVPRASRKNRMSFCFFLNPSIPERRLTFCIPVMIRIRKAFCVKTGLRYMTTYSATSIIQNCLLPHCFPRPSTSMLLRRPCIASAITAIRYFSLIPLHSFPPGTRNSLIRKTRGFSPAISPCIVSPGRFSPSRAGCVSSRAAGTPLPQRNPPSRSRT